MQDRQEFFGNIIKIDEKNLTTKEVISLINNKRHDCQNYEFCYNYFLNKELEYERKYKRQIKDGNMEPMEINWICPETCKFSQNDEDVLVTYTKKQLEKIEQDIDNMTDKEKYRFFAAVFFSKQREEKYGGITVEHYNRDINKDRSNTRCKATKRNKEQD